MLTQKTAIDTVRNYASEIGDSGVALKHVILYDSFASIATQKPYVRIETVTYPTDYFREGDPFIDIH